MWVVVMVIVCGIYWDCWKVCVQQLGQVFEYLVMYVNIDFVIINMEDIIVVKIKVWKRCINVLIIRSY